MTGHGVPYGEKRYKNLMVAIPLCCSTNLNIVQSKHNNVFNNVMLVHVSVTSNHHQADISVHGHDMFGATVWAAIL